MANPTKKEARAHWSKHTRHLLGEAADIIDAYNATGRAAFLYPRKRMVSLNGGRLTPLKDALKLMRETLKRA